MKLPSLIWIPIVLLMPSLIGCGAASFVSKRGDAPSQYAPTNEGRGGVVKYYANSLVGQKKERQSAYKKMSKYCGGPYKILSEEKGGGGRNVTALELPTGQPVYAGSPEFIYISFECEEVRP